jgi:hypothetical protein
MNPSSSWIALEIAAYLISLTQAVAFFRSLGILGVLPEKPCLRVSGVQGAAMCPPNTDVTLSAI